MVAMAVGAHPDDIEFMMAGTLLLLKEAGAEIHMWNLANGCLVSRPINTVTHRERRCASPATRATESYSGVRLGERNVAGADAGAFECHCIYGTGHLGTTVHDRDEIVRLRWEEAQASAREAGATIHPPLFDDMSIVYDPSRVTKVASVIRVVKPDILLVLSPRDYMEDHVNTCRLLVAAAFARGMLTYVTAPPVEPWQGSTVIYHAMPYGLRDELRKTVKPGQYVDIESVLAKKRAMLAEHRTQMEWLVSSQGVGSYPGHMEEMCRKVGKMSGRFTFAEGWTRHSHLGFSPSESDPIKELLGTACWVDPDHELSLE